MRHQRSNSQIKEKYKTPEEQQQSGDTQSTQKRIQSNDSKDDPKSQKIEYKQRLRKYNKCSIKPYKD